MDKELLHIMPKAGHWSKTRWMVQIRSLVRSTSLFGFQDLQDKWATISRNLVRLTESYPSSANAGPLLVQLQLVG